MSAQTALAVSVAPVASILSRWIKTHARGFVGRGRCDLVRPTRDCLDFRICLRRQKVGLATCPADASAASGLAPDDGRSTKIKPHEGYQVFVSHATADKWIAKVLCEKLEAVGALTFRDDRDIDGADDIPDRLRDEIGRSQELVVLLTPKSVSRPWVLTEVGGAWIRSIRIVAIRYHIEVDAIPATIKSKKSIDLNQIDEYLAEVEMRVKGGRE